MVKDKTLVFGASIKPDRYSNLAIKKLVRYNKNVRAFGLRSGLVEGVGIEDELRLHEDIDTITLYLSPPRQTQYYDHFVALSPRRVIFNPGTENPQLYNILRQHNIEVEVACTLVLLSTNQY
ncbi:hypothetical protein SAMN03097699_1538 [Flavobacteriaceae bacterium MAR_2010_188]|nr:hypothetical protein SAMN03097699_1538 [Flavobacteriaceae bacterium MAR_2010_188]